MAELFELNDISYQYHKGQPALSGINLKIDEGKITSILGSNGSGKSTLLNLLCGLVFPSSGTIAFRGDVFNEKSFANNQFNQKFRSSIGYIFQNSDAQLFCSTVFDELVFGPLQLGYSKEVAFDRASDVANMLHINDLLERPVYMLSGGEKKRVAIGAVLTSNPDVLIIDEPVSGLDPKTRSFLIELILRLNQAGKTIIIATHHLELVDHLQSDIIVLNEKHTVERTGSCNEILSDMDLLLKTNLLGEYPHIHNNTIHKHLSPGFLFHNHPSKES